MPRPPAPMPLPTPHSAPLSPPSAPSPAQSRRAPWRRGVVLVAGLVAGLARPAGAEDAVVTALLGAARVDGAAIALDTGIPSGARLETEAGARLALLAERDVLLQLYGETDLTLTSVPDGAPVVDARSGSFRAAIGTRPHGLRLEVRTPSARVVPIGALAHLQIDPDTGETRITCLDEKVLVHGLDGVSKRSVILNRNQEVTVRPGEGPGPIQKVGGQAEGGAPLVTADYGFRSAALASESRRTGGGWRARIAAIDMPNDELPPVSSNRPSGVPRFAPFPSPDLDLCDPTTCDVLRIEVPPGPVAAPPSCPPNAPPSEACQF